MKVVSSTKHVPSSLRLVEPLEHSHRGKLANLDFFDHSILCRLGIHDEFVLNAVLDPRFMPMFMIENFIITLNPNGPKGNAPKKMPNFNFLVIFFGKFFPKITFQLKQL